MIHCIGTDVFAVARIIEFHRKFGERALEKVMAPDERPTCREAREQR